MPTFDMSKAKPPVDRNQQILDIFAPPDDGGSVPQYTGNENKGTLKAFDLSKAKPPGLLATGKIQFDLSKATHPELGPTTASAPSNTQIAPQLPKNPEEGITGKLASIFEPSQKAGANLISGVMAPFLSDKSKKILQDKGLYTPGESPLHEFSTAAYGTITAPIQPIVEAVAGKAKQAGEATIGKKATDTAGDLLNTGMDVLGFALPGVARKAEAVTPLSVETKLTQLEKQHDATTNAAKQEKIKQQMMDVLKEHPEFENAQKKSAAGSSSEIIKATPAMGQKMAELEKKHDASTDPAVQAQIKQQMMDIVTLGEKKTFDLSKAKPPEGRAVSSPKNIFSPEGAGARAEDTGTTIRAETGTANRNTAKAEATLAKSYDTAAKLTPEQRGDFFQYVEGRSKGATLADPFLQKMADETRSVMEGVRKNIETLPKSEEMGFYQDYFPHQFKNPEKARAFANDFIAKQGSSANLKKRTFPTLADAEKAGLELADNNPVRAASRYATSMHNYIASKHIASQIIEKGDAKYYIPGKQPEGWVPLTGRFAERTRSYTKEVPGEDDVSAHAMHEKLFAPPEVARVYNNFYSKGLEKTDLAKPYELARSLNAANTAAELSLSAFHFGTITGQLLANDVSRVLKNTLVGDWAGVGKAVKSATAGQIPFLKGSSYRIGKNVIKQYKGLSDYGIDMESIAEHFERGGGKVGQEKLYRANEKGGLITGRGGIKQAARDLKETFAEPGLTPKAKAALEVFQRVTEDVSYPLFEKYIPSIKTGAFANLMGDWVRQHPNAGDTEIAAARRKYVDLVDDRFGEMNMDNVFWHKYLKQFASVFARAQGWDIGLVRQAGGGIMDTVDILKTVFKGRKIPEHLLDRPAFLASIVGTMALMSASYQYMKTGQAPNQMLDLFVPKTGGVSTRGTPERTMLPTAAHGRELVHLAAPFASEGALGTESPIAGLTQEVSNKIASLPRNLTQAYENEDYFGNKISPTTGPAGWVGSIPGRVGHVAGGFAPFSFTGQGDKLKGSNLSGVERRLFGMRPAGMEIADPENFKQMRWAQELKKEVKAYKTEKRHEGQKE